jgi:hypothetical protein
VSALLTEELLEKIMLALSFQSTEQLKNMGIKRDKSGNKLKTILFDLRIGKYM